MPVFSSNNSDLPDAPADGIVNVLTPLLAPGTERQSATENPEIVELPRTELNRAGVPQNLLAPVPDPPVAGIPTLATSTTAAAAVLAGIESFASRPLRALRTGLSSSSDDGGFSVESDIDGLPEFQEAIAFLESSGNARAVGPQTRYGTAKGRYQFIDATWERAARLVPGASRYPTALSAPASVQDQVATAWFTSLFERYGSWELVAVAHHAGEGTANNFQRTGQLSTSDVLGTQTSDYAQRALRRAFG